MIIIIIIRGFYRSSGPSRENKRKRKERQIFRSCRWTINAVEHEGDSDTNRIWSLERSPTACKWDLKNWIYSDDIGIEFGIEKYAMLKMKSKKKTNDRRKKTTKSRKNQNARRKEKI